MDCLFCRAAVPFDQHKMAYHVYELTDVENRWRLCGDCAEIRTDGEKFRSGGRSDERGACVDCDEDAAFGVALLKETPAGEVVPNDAVYHVLCETHLDERTHDDHPRKPDLDQ